MKKLLLISLLVLLFSGCNNENKIKQITCLEAIEKRQVVLISKSVSIEHRSWSPVYFYKRSAFISNGDKVYYVYDVPENIWDDYFEEKSKGDTITFF